MPVRANHWHVGPSHRLRLCSMVGGECGPEARAPTCLELLYFQPAEPKGQASGASHRPAATGFISM